MNLLKMNNVVPLETPLGINQVMKAVLPRLLCFVTWLTFLLPAYQQPLLNVCNSLFLLCFCSFEDQQQQQQKTSKLVGNAYKIEHKGFKTECLMYATFLGGT